MVGEFDDNYDTFKAFLDLFARPEAGEGSGRPSRGYQSAKSSSHHSPSSRSLTRIAVVPPRLPAPVQFVRSKKLLRTCWNGDGGTAGSSEEAVLVGETAPGMPADHAGAPGISKIHDRVRLEQEYLDPKSNLSGTRVIPRTNVEDP